MASSLRRKLTISYVLIIVFSMVLVSLLASVFLEKQFTQYIIEHQEQENQQLVGLITQQYDSVNGWKSELVENIGINALQNGLIVKVRDNAGKIIWNARVYNNGMCQDIIVHMSQNMYNRYPNWQGEYKENSYPVMVDSKKVGTVEIGYYGPFYFTDTDIAFLNTLNKISALVGIISVLIAIVLSSIMAKRLSSPISRVIKTSRMIEKGNYSDRVDVKSNIKEINQLTETINTLAASLEKQENLRKRLTGDVAHELRTPIATLQSHMEAMIDGIWEADEERLKSCHEEIVRIGKLVGDLEKLTRLENERLVLDKTTFDISELIKGIALNFESQFKAKGVNLSFEEKRTEITGDRDKISQVIINLLSNSLKYTPEGGSVEVCVSREEDYVVIRFKDNGIGISSEDLPFIFERFYRADKSRSRMTGGSGIGLSIVKTIVEAHGGTIEARSKINEGSEFIVKLPA